MFWKSYVWFSDPPGPPQNPMVSDVTKDKCHLTWEPPASDGGSPVIGYHVERRQVGSSRWLKINKDIIPDLTYDVNDLIEGTEYEFRIMAENKIGVGPPSETTSPITAKDPYGRGLSFYISIGYFALAANIGNAKLVRIHIAQPRTATHLKKMVVMAIMMMTTTMIIIVVVVVIIIIIIIIIIITSSSSSSSSSSPPPPSSSTTITTTTQSSLSLLSS